MSGGLPRLRQLVIASPHAEMIDMLRDVLGLDAPFADPGVAEFGLVNGVFAVGDQFLEVVVPVARAAPAQRFIDRGGAGGYMAIFQTGDLDAVRARADEMKVRRVWNIDLDDISASHLHPADMGAAIVSVDEARPAGSWRWGGPDWNRRSKIGRLTGAVIEGPDPEALATRWADVLGAERDGLNVQLEDALLTFQAGVADRLTVFKMRLPDADAVLERARAAGLKAEGRSVWLSGVEIQLAD